MVLQQDSIAHGNTSVPGDSAVPQRTVLTPKMVLSWLPRNATPAQQDSAIQAHFKPSEIRWSQRPDTLHLPGHDKGRNLLDAQLPQYYREGFFSKDTLFHPELPGGRYGVAGDPINYSISGDNVITTLLLVCFMMAVISIANARGFIIRQAKSLVWLGESTSDVSETTNELRFQTFLAFLTCTHIALLCYLYTIGLFGDTFVLKSKYYLIAIFLALITGYFLLKLALYSIVNIVFFGGKRNVQWIKSLLFITSLEGILLFPAVVLQAYFGLTQQNVIIYCFIILGIVKILTIYKCYTIFFRHLVVRLQIFLYFCTLEIVPLLSLWTALEITANSLKINF